MNEPPDQRSKRSWTDRVLPAAALAAAVSLFVLSATSVEAAPIWRATADKPTMAAGVASAR
jgi:hypothetical protein